MWYGRKIIFRSLCALLSLRSLSSLTLPHSSLGQGGQCRLCSGVFGSCLSCAGGQLVFIPLAHVTAQPWSSWICCLAFPQLFFVTVGIPRHSSLDCSSLLCSLLVWILGSPLWSCPALQCCRT